MGELKEGVGYWGGIDELMKELFHSPKIEQHCEEVASTSEDFAASENLTVSAQPAVQTADHLYSSSDAEPEPSLDVKTEPFSDAKPESSLLPAKPDESRASPALGKEINALRYRYLRGKLAGQDLLDEVETIIIRKNDPITPEVIDLADRKGKLAELIVNMTIPELVE